MKNEKLIRLAGDVFNAEDDPTPTSLISNRPEVQARIELALGVNSHSVSGSGPPAVNKLHEEIKELKARLKFYERLYFKGLF